MKLRMALTYAAPFVLATTIGAGNAHALFYDNVYELQDRTISGDSFNAELARDYRELTDFEWNQMYDWSDAENHAAKGNMAAEGMTPMPNVPAAWNIESESNLRELESARAQLVTALDRGGRTNFPKLAVEAQTKFDCWVEQQEEGHQPTRIAACNDQFWTAMNALNDAMTPDLVKTTVTQEIARETVYFNFDDAAITTAAQFKIDAFVKKIREIDGTDVAIVGHTDTMGPDGCNQELSERRAESVSTEMIRQGMNVRSLDEVDVVAKGESDPAVKTGDKVRKQLNRRVEIIAISDVVVEQQVTELTSK